MESKCKIPQKNTFCFQENIEKPVIFDSDFDSGNLYKVVRLPDLDSNHHHYNLWTASDCQGTTYEGYPKSWFMFSVEGYANMTVRFTLHRMHALFSLLKTPKLYKPVCRSEQDKDWIRLPNEITSLSLSPDDDLTLTFDYRFSQSTGKVYFAYSYPYSYEYCQDRLKKMTKQYEQKPHEFLFKRHLLARSPEGRNIDLIMLSSWEGLQGHEQLAEDDYVLRGDRIVRFESWKPVILVTARVHPIETPSSFCLEGMMEFLMSRKDARAHFLRKYFVFLFVPMLNPDGVSRGHCRMDIFNRNLNRHYQTPDPIEQPSCYAIKNLAQHYSKDRRLFMYIDLHAHPANKGNFMFGNAINDYVLQVQSNLFPKLLSLNCRNFEFQQCNFSRKQMKIKDRMEQAGKEGCGRVVFWKEMGLVHSYTLECGYHCNTFTNRLQPPKNTDMSYRLRVRRHKTIDGKVYEKQLPVRQHFQGVEHVGYVEDELDEAESQYYQRPIVYYELRTFYNLGRNILISLLDVWQRNPYPRTPQTDDLRKQLASNIRRLGRFRKEQMNLKVQEKCIVQLVQQQYYLPWYQKNVFNEPQRQQIKFKSLLANMHSLSKKKIVDETIISKQELVVRDAKDRRSIIFDERLKSSNYLRVSLKKM